jgi:hypothetical protein
LSKKRGLVTKKTSEWKFNGYTWERSVGIVNLAVERHEGAFTVVIWTTDQDDDEFNIFIQDGITTGEEAKQIAEEEVRQYALAMLEDLK